MKLRPGPAAPAAGNILALAPRNRRRHYRHKFRNLAYVKVESANGGVLRDLSERGIAIQAVSPLQCDQQIGVHLDLPAPRLRIEMQGRVVWADSLGQVGVSFLDVPAESRRLLNEWLFAQLFGALDRRNAETPGLLFSSSSRPAIRFDEQPFLAQQIKSSLRPLRFLGFSVSTSRFAGLVDGLVLLCAILLFCVMALAMVDTLPSWPVTAALALAITSIFAGVYRILFLTWFGTTPGTRLASLAGASEGWIDRKRADRARFR